MGFHCSRLLHVVFAKEKAHDHMEMILHHLCTLYLYGFSYLTNTFIGGVISVLHDFADIFVSFTRVFGESDYKNITGYSFLVALIAWAYTRLYVLPQMIYVIWYLPVYSASPNLKPIFIFLLLCLLVLHIYWFILCCKIMYFIVTLGVTEDLQNKMDDKPLPSKSNGEASNDMHNTPEGPIKKN